MGKGTRARGKGEAEASDEATGLHRCSYWACLPLPSFVSRNLSHLRIVSIDGSEGVWPLRQYILYTLFCDCDSAGAGA